MIDGRGLVEPENPADPTRGRLAFETDVSIFNDKVPLVVLETKYASYSTHDLLTYSTKAIRHKEVYPYLRYGFVVEDVWDGGLRRTFFVHNYGFDFALAIRRKSDMNDLVRIVKRQIHAAELMLDALGDKPLHRFVSDLEVA